MDILDPSNVIRSARRSQPNDYKSPCLVTSCDLRPGNGVVYSRGKDKKKSEEKGSREAHDANKQTT